MNKKIIIFSVVIVIFTIVGLFQVNHRVQNLKKDLAELHRQIATDKAKTHILKAEWAYLNEPTRIKNLSDKYLNLSYTKVAQFKGRDNVKDIFLASAPNADGKSTTPTLRPILSSYKR